MFKKILFGLACLAISFGAAAQQPRDVVPVSIQGNPSAITTASGSISASNATLTVATGNASTVFVEITGNGTGFTITPQISQDGGNTYITVGLEADGSGATSAPNSAITTTGNWSVSVAQADHFRLLTSTGITGGSTLTANITASTAFKFIRSSAIGAQADTAATSGSGSSSLVSITKGLLNNTPAPGQATMANSSPVTIASNQSAVPVSVSVPEQYAITQTTVAITATSGQLIASNANRKYLAWMNIGTQSVTCIPGTGTAVAGTGFVYASGGSGLQGASQEFPHGAPTSAFQCIAPATGSTLIVWEGQ